MERQEVKELEQENNKELKINQLSFWAYFLSPWLPVSIPITGRDTGETPSQFHWVSTTGE